MLLGTVCSTYKIYHRSQWVGGRAAIGTTDDIVPAIRYVCKDSFPLYWSCVYTRSDNLPCIGPK